MEAFWNTFLVLLLPFQSPFPNIISPTFGNWLLSSSLSPLLFLAPFAVRQQSAFVGRPLAIQLMRSAFSNWIVCSKTVQSMLRYYKRAYVCVCGPGVGGCFSLAAKAASQINPILIFASFPLTRTHAPLIFSSPHAHTGTRGDRTHTNGDSDFGVANYGNSTAIFVWGRGQSMF